jgi:catechol 2,3-dioxygenase-like lactoylglutathione lyase family enzyme
MAKFPAPTEEIVMTHFIVSRNVERSRRFYTEVLGGETVLEGEPSIVALANGWIIINVGGGPTDDKPTVTLEAPSDQDRVRPSQYQGRRHPRRLRSVERARGAVSDPANRPRP